MVPPSYYRFAAHQQQKRVVLNQEMVKKGDEKLRFLMLHLPGMKDVAGFMHLVYATKKTLESTCGMKNVEGRNPEKTPN